MAGAAIPQRAQFTAAAALFLPSPHRLSDAAVTGVSTCLSPVGGRAMARQWRLQGNGREVLRSLGTKTPRRRPRSAGVRPARHSAPRVRLQGARHWGPCRGRMRTKPRRGSRHALGCRRSPALGTRRSQAPSGTKNRGPLRRVSAWDGVPNAGGCVYTGNQPAKWAHHRASRNLCGFESPRG